MTVRGDLVLISNFAPDRQESMLRFASVLREGFSSRGWNVHTWQPEPRFATLAGAYRYGGAPKYLGYVDKFIVFPRQLRARARRLPANTAYHIIDHGNAVYFPHLPSARTIVTCHDLLQIRSAIGEFSQNPVSGSGAKYQRWILKHLAQARRVVSVSKKTQTDLCRITPHTPASSPVIYMGLNYPYSPMPRDEAFRRIEAACSKAAVAAERVNSIVQQGFLVGVGGAQWYKNRTGLVRIFTELGRGPGAPPNLVYVGPALEPEQQTLLEQAGAQARFVRLSGLSNEDLRALYSVATALIFPSWEEGFGWPIAEAQACGCPVFTSNRAPMTEVGGGAARYLDPADPVGAASVIQQEAANLAAMSEEGLRWAGRWQTSRMLDEYESEYVRAIQESAT